MDTYDSIVEALRRMLPTDTAWGATWESLAKEAKVTAVIMDVMPNGWQVSITRAPNTTPRDMRFLLPFGREKEALLELEQYIGPLDLAEYHYEGTGVVFADIRPIDISNLRLSPDLRSVHVKPQIYEIGGRLHTTVVGAARILGQQESHVLALLRQNRIVGARRFDRDWIIPLNNQGNIEVQL